MVQYLHVIMLNNNTLFLHASILNPHKKNAILLECELQYNRVLLRLTVVALPHT